MICGIKQYDKTVVTSLFTYSKIIIHEIKYKYAAYIGNKINCCNKAATILKIFLFP